MSASDRTISFGLFAGAGMAWVAVAWVLTSLSPVESTVAQLLGAVLLGSATALTACPLVWLATASRPSESLGGSWTSSARRSSLIGLVVSVLVLLRVIDALVLPLVAFLAVTAVLVEIASTVRR